MVQNHVENERDLRRALDAEALPPAVRVPGGLPAAPELRYTDRVRYVEQLRRYHKVFPREQVLVLIYDDFRADNEATLRQVHRFLGVDDTLPLELVEANPSVRLRSVRMDDAVNSLKSGRRVGRALRAAGSLVTRASPVERPGRRAQPARLRRSRSRPNAELEAELRRRFAPEVEALSEYLDRDLIGLWGYDELG